MTTSSHFPNTSDQFHCPVPRRYCDDGCPGDAVKAPAEAAGTERYHPTIANPVLEATQPVAGRSVGCYRRLFKTHQGENLWTNKGARSRGEWDLERPSGCRGMWLWWCSWWRWCSRCSAWCRWRLVPLCFVFSRSSSSSKWLIC